MFELIWDEHSTRGIKAGFSQSSVVDKRRSFWYSCTFIWARLIRAAQLNRLISPLFYNLGIDMKTVWQAESNAVVWMIEVTWSFHRWFIEHKKNIMLKNHWGLRKHNGGKYFSYHFKAEMRISVRVSCNFRWVECKAGHLSDLILDFYALFEQIVWILSLSEWPQLHVGLLYSQWIIIIFLLKLVLPQFSQTLCWLLPLLLPSPTVFLMPCCPSFSLKVFPLHLSFL